MKGGWGGGGGGGGQGKGGGPAFPCGDCPGIRPLGIREASCLSDPIPPPCWRKEWGVGGWLVEMDGGVTPTLPDCWLKLAHPKGTGASLPLEATHSSQQQQQQQLSRRQLEVLEERGPRPLLRP
uniref:Uncharacterized protein n=1 Tax=Sphaerodactylus townsendi TaxID=933632 RepID=A0ACB8EF12_9SAUR